MASKFRSLTWPHGPERKVKDFQSWLVWLKTLADDGHMLPHPPERTPVVS